ncbi:MAG: XdhC family protein [Oligoflexia bacterium]|nr:XdhC family protein [Oligoflexia bacterium]MBF0365539.1 XdhC family protein [Oligoflexia bacterium]
MEFFKFILDNLKLKRKLAIITLVKVKGSVPQIPGAKLAVCHLPDALTTPLLTAGTVGGGALEHQALQEALDILKSDAQSKPSIHYIEKNLLNDLGMVCGGEVSYTIELISPPSELIICGAGHCGEALAQAAKNLDFSITIIDSMQSFANRERYPFVDKIINSFEESDLDRELQHREHAGKNSYVVIVSRDHATDFRMARYFMNKEWCYLGVIASKAKSLKLKKELGAAGFPPEKISRLTSPIGLDLGGSSPAEIAISILAQIISLKNRSC